MGRTALVVGFLLAGAAIGFSHAQEIDRTDADLPHGGGIIRGVVTAAGTGVPVHGATIRALVSSLDAAPVTTITDSEGAFELRGLAPGRWRIDAAKSGFLTRSFGQRGRSPQVGTVTVKDRTVATANIALVRGGIVAGRVFDEFGDPAVAVRVEVMELRATDNGGWLTPAGVPDITDDTGGFRVYNLPPGEYVVSARAPSFREVMNVGGPVQRLLAGTRPGGPPRSTAPIYFPGTPDVAAAEPVVLRAGDERADIDFTLSKVRPVRVSGRVLNSAGESPSPTGSTSVPPPVSVSLRGEVQVESMLMSSSPNAGAGRFDFPDVPPGSYVITATIRGIDGRPLEFGDVPITVASEDITGLTIVTGPGATLTGSVVSSSGTLPDLRGAAFAAVSANRGNGSAAVTDGTFQLPGMVGEFRLDLTGLPAEWTVESIEIDGVDVTDTPVTFKSGQRQATVNLTNRLTELSGVVTKNRQPIEAEIAVFPDDPVKWTSQRYVRSMRATGQGAFAVRGLPPHDSYLAVATEYVDPGELQDPGFLERLRSRATSFSLEQGQARRLRLTFVERSALEER